MFQKNSYQVICHRWYIAEELCLFTLIHEYRSSAQLTYDEAQKILDNPLDSSTDKYGNQIAKDIQSLYQLSTILRENRQKSGLFTQMRDELEYEFEDGNKEQPVTVSVRHKKPAALMVKEFLFLANKSVAQKISSQFPNHALLRRHGAPSERKIVSVYSHQLKNKRLPTIIL